MTEQGVLIYFCGKMGAGKSTKSKQVSLQRNALLISEDEWLAALYPEQIKSFDDYIQLSSQLKPLLKEHVQRLLMLGTTVVMDFPANTKKQRAWFNHLALEIDAKSELIYLKVDNALCLKQIQKRRTEQPSRENFDTEQMFYQVTKYFEVPNEIKNVTIIERES